jgi:hypothetical protein
MYVLKVAGFGGRFSRRDSVPCLVASVRDALGKIPHRPLVWCSLQA